MEKKLLVQVGNKVRKKLETIQSSPNKLYWQDDLCGACATASYMLQKELSALGIESSIVVSADQHAWLETKKYLIDVTYTQFSSRVPKVVILSKRTPAYKSHIRKLPARRKVALTYFKCWPKEQNPTWVMKYLKS